MYLILILFVCAMLAFWLVLKKKNMDIWFFSYIKSVLNRPKVKGPVHVMFCFVDHFEPQWKNRDNIELERARVDRWFKDYPLMAEQHKDADGHMPKHCFFYPEEEYRYEHLAKLSDMCYRGFGEMEIHLHHDNDTPENFTKVMTNFAKRLHHDHGALPVHPETEQIMYAFIHGNWSLDNSLPNGYMCGIDNELSLLNKTGCYVDMTLPATPSPAQTTKVNSIYYATGRPGKCKSHDTGIDVKVGEKESGDIMLIQGPIGINFSWRTAKGLPHVENADVRKACPPLKSRVDQWVNSHIHVKGRPEWVFIKVHTHGTQEADMDTLLGQPRHDMHSYLETKYNDKDNYILHYVSAREMYNIAKAAEAGKYGDPNEYRDFILPKPKFKSLS